MLHLTKSARLRHTRSSPASFSVRIEHQSLDDKIYARLRSMIVEHRLRAGERILQDHLAKEMGVSRTPLVNALKRLAQERLVEWVSRRGIYVKRFSKREMARLFMVREVLEGLATRLAALRIEVAEVDRLTERLRGLDLAPRPGGVRRYMEWDRCFHWRLVELADNPQLAGALDSVNMMFFAYQDGLVRPPAETFDEHLTILDALRRHDPDASEVAMRLHIRRSVERLEQEAGAEEVQGE